MSNDSAYISVYVVRVSRSNAIADLESPDVLHAH